MEKGLLSVIITTYRRDFDILSQAIESVLAQTYKKIELIVVDDNEQNSVYTERLRAGLEGYPGVRYLKMRENSGACAARNAGILESNGEFVGFLDDDDLWLPTKAEKQLLLFDDPNTGLVFCQGYNFTGDDTENRTLYYTARDFNPAPTFEDMLWVDRIGSTSQAIIRRETFCTCGLFDANMPARQDYEMWLRITKKRICARGVPEPLFLYRHHSGEQITKTPLRALYAYKRLYHLYIDDFKQRKNRIADFTALTTLYDLNRRCGHRVRGFTYLIRAFFRTPAFFIRCMFKRGKKRNREK